MKEVWKDIAGYEGLYQVSNKGNVRSLDHAVGNRFYSGRSVKQRLDSYGYLIVTFFKKGTRKDYKVHRLVATTFISNPNNYPTVNHKNEIKTCNEVWNLEWMTVRDNNNYGSRNSKIAQSKIGKKCDWEKGEKNYFYGKRFCGKDSHSAKKVYQYTLDGKFIKSFDSAREAAKEIGVTDGMVGMVCRGQRKQARGYLFYYSPVEEV